MTRYQISIYGEKLPKQGIFHHTCPNVYATIHISGGTRDKEYIGTTEMIYKTCTPDFTKVFFIETDPSINLPITVRIYHTTSHSNTSIDISSMYTTEPPNTSSMNAILLIEATFEVTEVFLAPGHVLSSTTNPIKNNAIVYVSVEESQKGSSNGVATIQFRGLDIKNVEPGLLGLGRSDPFFEVSRKNADHTAGVVRWNTIYRSTYIMDHLNPLWDAFTISLEELCYCDLNWPIKVTVYDYNRNGRQKEIGMFETTIYEMSQRISIRGNADRDMAYELLAPSFSIRQTSTSNESNVTRGLMVILQCMIQLE